MYTQAANLQLNIGFIAQQTIGFSRVLIFDIPNIRLQPDLTLYDLTGEANVSRTSEGLLVRVKLSASVEVACARCLKEFFQFLQVDFTELFLFASHARSTGELILPDDGSIDLGSLVREYMLLEIPMNPVCKPDCKGLCPVCGANLNIETCNCKIDNVKESPFKVLSFYSSGGGRIDNTQKKNV